MDIVNNLPIYTQRNILAQLTLPFLISDPYLANYVIKENWFPKSHLLIYCMEKNLVTIVKLLFYHTKQKNISISAYHFIKTIGHAILYGHFEALYIFMNFFLEETCMYQKEIWEICEKIKNNKYVTKHTPKCLRHDLRGTQRKLQTFYELLIKVLYQNTKMKNFMWNKLDIYILTYPNKCIFERLLKRHLLDPFICIHTDKESYFYYVPDELIQTLLRLHIPVHHQYLKRYITYEDIRIETLHTLHELGYMKEFRYPSYSLQSLLDTASPEIFMFLANFAGFSEDLYISKRHISTKNIKFLKYIHNKFTKNDFNHIKIDLQDIYIIPSGACNTYDTPSQDASFVIEFLHAHKIVVNAGLDHWLMLAINANDTTMVTQLLGYVVSYRVLQQPLMYSQRLGRKHIEEMILAKSESYKNKT
jgi:hypothetical protein